MYGLVLNPCGLSQPLSEDFADLPWQLVRQRGLLDKMDPWFQDSPVGNDVFGIPRHVNNGHVRVPLTGLIDDLSAVHLWHNDVRDDQIEFFSMTANLKGCMAISRLQDVVAFLTKLFDDDPSDDIFIFDD